jgi:TRAP-type C4-dicarboxylate transport system substrate-binding protein
MMKALSKLLFVAASLLAAGSGNIVFAQSKPAMNMLIANTTANDTQAAAADKFGELITKYSEGRINASARHGGALGGLVEVLPTLQAGSVHAMIFPGGNLSVMVPEFSLFDMPFLFPSAPAKISAFAAQSKAMARMKELAEQKAIHIVGFHGIGAGSPMTKFPLTKLTDLQGKKFLSNPSPSQMGAYQDWGAIGRPMALSELYTSLQQGNLDGVTFPPDVLYKMKMHEAAKNYTITDHFTLVSTLLVSKRWFDGLPKDLQEAVSRAAKDTMTWADDAYTRTQQSSLDALKKTINVTTMPPAELQKMKDAAHKGIWQKMKADPQRGPLMKLFEEDIANFNKTAS